MIPTLRSLLFAASVLAALAPGARAGTVGPLIQFSNGDVADANEVNQNFGDLRTEVNDNAGDIVGLDTRLDAAEADLDAIQLPIFESATATDDSCQLDDGTDVDGICFETTFDVTFVGEENAVVTTLASLTLDAPGAGVIAIDAFTSVDRVCTESLPETPDCPRFLGQFKAWVTEGAAGDVNVRNRLCDFSQEPPCFRLSAPSGAIPGLAVGHVPRDGADVTPAGADTAPPQYLSALGVLDVGSAGPVTLNLVAVCPRPVEAGETRDSVCVVDPAATTLRATFHPE